MAAALISRHLLKKLLIFSVSFKRLAKPEHHATAKSLSVT